MSDENSSAPQPAQRYMPLAFSSTYSPVNGALGARPCAGSRTAPASSSSRHCVVCLLDLRRMRYLVFGVCSHYRTPHRAPSSATGAYVLRDPQSDAEGAAWQARPATSSSPAASCPHSARASPPRRSAACSSPAGLTVGLQKFDPYINVDPGTMSPYQHGEVFVTEDGAETDLDLGHYERFTDANTSRASNVTAGGDLQLGHPPRAPRRLPRRTVQVVPHITDEIKQRIRLIAETQRRRRRRSPRSAARSATSSRCRSSRRSASSRSTSAGATACSCT